jgi:CHAT domain-containing protein/Tfp pilus assembly protein PilF
MAAYRAIIIVAAACLLDVGDSAMPAWQADYDRTVQLMNHAEFEKARSAAETGYRAWGNRPQTRAGWLFRLALAESLIELDRIPDSLPLLATTSPTADDEARRLADLAIVHLRSHEDEQVRQCLAKARSGAAPTSHELLGKIELIQGTLQLQQEQLTESEASFRRALAEVEGSHSLIESYTLSDLGFLDLRRFRYDEAVYWFGRARELAQQNGMRRALDLALGNIGVAFLELGELERATKSLGEATALAETLHDRVYQMRWLVVLGETWYQLGDFGKATEYYQKARLLGNPERDRGWLANILDDLSRIALQKGDPVSSQELNSQGTALARQMESPRYLLTQRIQTAAIAAARREFTEAKQIYTDALATSRRVGDPVTEWQCHAGLASLYREAGAASSAEREYQAAIGIIDQEHAKLQRDESKFSFLSHLIQFYRDYVDFLVDRGDIAGAFRVAESCRARVLEEKLHRTGEQATTPESLAAEARASGAILLSYWLAPRRSLFWVIDSSGLHGFSLPPEEEIASRVRRHNEAIQRNENLVETGDEAGRWLFANLLADHYRVPKDRNVIIAPDGILHQLNFESLPPTGGSHYWLEDNTISIAPSLALLRRLPAAPRSRLLVFGDPGFEGTEFRPLLSVKAELSAVEKHFPERSVYVSAAATPAAFRKASPESFSILHFATHAVANSESPLDSAIILAGPSGERKLYARDILQQRLNADLVTLSACQTAGSRSYYGEGLTGFSWAFLSAGAHNVVSGLWDVDDRATAQLMAGFYNELASATSPVSALRKAKLTLLASDGAYRKPRYWAAFVVFTRVLGQ